nr:PREDICTED: uncharacterized protein LOC108220974 [Daucus carota subsp. sativus]
MELQKYDSIQDLTTTRFDWNCRLRLQCVWRASNPKTKELWGLNMIYIDDSNYRIHAFASSKYCKDLINELKEGKIYILSNFKVKNYVGDETYRAVRNNKHIYFTTHTKFAKDVDNGLHIDRHAFDLFYMGEMQNLAADNCFLVDVLGEIRNVRANIKSTKTASEKILTKFDLFDGRHTLSVTLFDDFGKQFEQTLRCCKEEQVFVIICGAKIGMYEGLPNLTNYSATRIYINPGHYSVRQLRERMVAIKQEKADSPPAEVMIYPMLTVKEIQSLAADSGECKVKCKVRVTKVEENASWYYSICTKCPREIVQEKGVFNCVDCKRIIPYPDKSDSTGSIAIIFLDEDVSRILEKSVFDIEAEAIQVYKGFLAKMI